MPVNGMQPQNENRFAYKLMDDPTMQQAVSAGKSGQKDVFDASALGALINVGDVNEEIDSYISDMVKALDKLGRTLFLMYWHSEDLTERSGAERQHQGGARP
jgi:hypothetical protein